MENKILPERRAQGRLLADAAKPALSLGVTPNGHVPSSLLLSESDSSVCPLPLLQQRVVLCALNARHIREGSWSFGQQPLQRSPEY